MDRLRTLFRNYYFLLSLLFVIWMAFFDSNNLIGIYSLKTKISDLEDQKEYYEEKIVEVQKTKEELLSDPDKLEKFAREKYLMKKAGEDLYVIQHAD
jgi:cell division protein DivIC